MPSVSLQNVQAMSVKKGTFETPAVLVINIQTGETNVAAIQTMEVRRLLTHAPVWLSTVSMPKSWAGGDIPK